MKTPIMASLLVRPPDGFTKEEKAIARLLTEETVDTLYSKLPNSRMKAILALHFELGYTQDVVARIFGVSQSQISLDIKNIQRILMGGDYQKHTKVVRVKIGDAEIPLWREPININVEELLAFLYTFKVP